MRSEYGDFQQPYKPMLMLKVKKIRFPGLLIKMIALHKKKIRWGNPWNENRTSSILESQVYYLLNIYSGHKHLFYYYSSIILDLDNFRWI